jgi:riboflavin kinase/FMN adenylyltransferase
MQRWRGAQAAPSGWGRSVVTIGVFDGVHKGHQQIIGHAVKRAGELGVQSVVVTFDPHPSEVVRPGSHPAVLTEPARKAELIEALGVEELVLIPFDAGFAQQTPAEFVDHVLVERLRATRVSVGENFRFGHKAAGDPAMLEADARFETRVVPLVEVDGEIVSSSHIRALVLAGEVETATRFLGAPFQLRGEVVVGDRRGRTLGFPTANLVPDEALVCPGHGIYAARTAEACAAVSIGVRPTFGTGRALLVEAYLLDFDGDLYGRELRIDFIARLRGERRFESPEALIEQMRLDVQRTREICRSP